MKILRLSGIIIGVLIFLVLAIGSTDTDEQNEVSKAVEGTEKKTEKQENVEKKEDVKKTKEVVETTAPPIPNPIKYAGKGDDVIQIKSPEKGTAFVLNIKGNKNKRHFAVKGFDDNGIDTKLFVNTTDSYNGIVLDESGSTSSLEIKSSGSWEIEVQSIRSLKTIEPSKEFNDTGDSVILVKGSAQKAKIKGNSKNRHFAVKAFTPSVDLLVNTTDAYDGTVRFPKSTQLIEITAEGKWSILLN